MSKVGFALTLAVSSTLGFLTYSASASAQAPTVTRVSPNYGTSSGGAEVTVFGDYLENVRSVHFGAVAGTIVEEECGGMCEIIPYTVLLVRSPAHHAGTVDVTVTTSAGTSTIGAGDRFTYLTAKSPALILKAGGRYVRAGAPTLGTVSFGPCGSLLAHGTLVSNDERTDKAGFASTEHEGGGCGEGGPIITGSLSATALTATGQLTVDGHLSYDVTLTGCVYTVKKLTGALALPGTTQASVSGVGTLAAHSARSCSKAVPAIHAQASLSDLETSELFEAEA